MWPKAIKNCQCLTLVIMILFVYSLNESIYVIKSIFLVCDRYFIRCVSILHQFKFHGFSWNWGVWFNAYSISTYANNHWWSFCVSRNWDFYLIVFIFRWSNYLNIPGIRLFLIPSLIYADDKCTRYTRF